MYNNTLPGNNNTLYKVPASPHELIFPKQEPQSPMISQDKRAPLQHTTSNSSSNSANIQNSPELASKNGKIVGLNFSTIGKPKEKSTGQPQGLAAKRPSLNGITDNPPGFKPKVRRGSHDLNTPTQYTMFNSQLVGKGFQLPDKVSKLEHMARVVTAPNEQLDSPLKQYKQSLIGKNISEEGISMQRLNTLVGDKKENDGMSASAIKMNNLDTFRNKPVIISHQQTRWMTLKTDGDSPLMSPVSPQQTSTEVQKSSMFSSQIQKAKFNGPTLNFQIFKKKPVGGPTNQIEDRERKCNSARQPAKFNSSIRPECVLEGFSPSKKPEQKKPIKKEDFVLGKKLGKGRFGDVFVVKHCELGFVCAMKVISKQMIREQKIELQFARELKIQCFSNHPNVTAMYGYFEDNQNVYLLMELCNDGHLLKQLKERKRLPQQQVQNIVRQVCIATEYLHRNNVLHRDIKPENIIMHEGVVKLCDFGWAIYTKQPRETFCGTPLYVSPEILKGDKYDDKTDVWSVGVLTYELLVGKPPFRIQSETDLNKIITDEICFPEYVEISNEAKDLITSVLKKDPAKRPDIEHLLTHPFLRQTAQVQTI